MKKEVTTKYTQEGAVRITVEVIPYSELRCFTLPKSCMQCPNGYSCSGTCGRNVPFKDDDYQRRPKTCKLTLYNEE